MAQRLLAQYGVPPPQIFNWEPQVRTGAPYVTWPDSFDWTGFDFFWASLPYYGPGYSTLTHNYGQKSGNTQGYVGGASGVAGVQGWFAGASTYKFAWKPPHDLSSNPGALNYTIFPPQQLFTLLRTDINSFDNIVQGGSTAGLTGHGQVNDGWGHNSTFSTVPGFATMLPPYNVLPAVMDGGDPFIAHKGLGSSGDVTLNGIQSGGQAGALLTVMNQVFPITLTQPDVFGHPESGDSKNQFVYDSAKPANLRIPAHTSVLRSNNFDVNWLVSSNTAPPTEAILIGPLRRLLAACSHIRF